MKIDKIVHDDYCVLALKGEFDTFYVTSLQQEVEALLETGTSHIILNLRLVKFINSTALGAIIRAYKMCRAANGDLVIACPSPLVRELISKVGIDQLVSVYDDEAQAVKHLIKNLNALELAGSAPVNQEKVLISFPDETRNQQIGGRRPLIGSMGNVNGEGLQFVWDPAKAGLTTEQAQPLFVVGSELQMKFQVKVFKKGYFELGGTVSDIRTTDDGAVKVSVRFTAIPDADFQALSQFAEDMEFLKRQLPQ